MSTKRELEKYLRYDPATGFFYSTKKRKGIRGIGAKAGSVAKNGYIEICVKQKRYYAHRLAWFWVYGKFPKQGIDHINGKKADNRISNLRLASPSQNTAWRKLNKNNTSGFRGVYWFRPAKLWASKIKVNWKDLYLGYYSDKIEAAKAYDAAAIKHFGIFAKTNEAMGLFK